MRLVAITVSMSVITFLADVLALRTGMVSDIYLVLTGIIITGALSFQFLKTERNYFRAAVGSVVMMIIVWNVFLGLEVFLVHPCC